MKKVKKVNAIDVKRTYLISDLVRKSDNKKYYLGKISEDQFQDKFKKAKKQILKLSENVLNTMIAKTNPKRLVAFDTCDWYIGTFNIKEVGVWRRAGNLPLEWTNDSLEKTAEHVSLALKNKSKKLKRRVKSTIPNILKTSIDIIQNEKYFLPIVFEGGTGTKGRRMLRIKTKGDIDDGCMRSIALAISGKKEIKAYLGFPVKV